MGQLLETKVVEIVDPELLSLLGELEEACGIRTQDFDDLPLLHFLTQCVYPGGPEKRVAITTQHVAFAPLLESRIGKLPDGPLREFCTEMAAHAQSSLEFFSGNKVYVFLNRTLPRFAPPRATEKQKRWDAVIRQRRSNRQ